MRTETQEQKSAEGPAWMGWAALYAALVIIKVYAGS